MKYFTKLFTTSALIILIIANCFSAKSQSVRIIKYNSSFKISPSLLTELGSVLKVEFQSKVTNVETSTFTIVASVSASVGISPSIHDAKNVEIDWLSNFHDNNLATLIKSVNAFSNKKIII